MAGSGNNTRNPQNANDNYPAAALRHFHDAEILRAAIDSGLASAMPIGIMPPKLYKDHPSRRYQRCFPVTEQEMADCQAFAQSMEQVIMNMLMDGLITI